MASYSEKLRHAMTTRPPDHPVYRYNSKTAGRELVESVGVPVPELFAGPCRLDAIESPRRDVVVKPVNGCFSRGVFPLVHVHDDTYRNLWLRKTMTWADVHDAAMAAKHSERNQHLLTIGHPDAMRPPWIAEQLITRGNRRHVADDVKVFVFGFEPALYLQMRRDGKKTRDKTYDAEWRPTGDIRTPSNHYESLPTPRNRDLIADTASRIARAVGEPFLRVDLFEQDSTVYFGEITPHPNGGTVKFSPVWDAYLGERWEVADASVR